MRKKFKSKCVIFFAVVILSGIFLCGAKASAATYYIDNTNGDDNNSGISENFPWKTMGMANGGNFLSGDNILFKRGGIWRDILAPLSNGSEGNYITFGAYGSGNKPKILSSVSWNDSSGWINGGNNIWRTVYVVNTGDEILLNTSFDSGTNGWGFYVNNESGAVAVGERTEIPGEYYSAPGGYRISSSGVGKTSSDMQFFSASFNPLHLKSGKYYRLEFKARASQPASISKITLHKNTDPYTLYADGSPIDVGTIWKKYSINFKSIYTVADGRVTFYLGDSLPAGTNFFIDDISLKENLGNVALPANIGNLIFDNGVSYGTKKMTFADVKSDGDFYDDRQNDALFLYSDVNPAVKHYSIDLVFDQSNINLDNNQYLKFENLWMSQSGKAGLNAVSSSHIKIINCDVSQIGGSIHWGTTRYGNGIQFWNSSDDMVVENNKIWEIYDAAISTQGTGVAQVRNHIYRNNVIWNSEYGFEFWHRPAETIVENIKFEHNTIVDSGMGWGHYQRPDGPNGRALMLYYFPAAKAGIDIKNNLMVNATESLIRSWAKSDMDNININYNYYSNSMGLLAQVDRESSQSSYTMNQSSEWKAQQSKDTNSIFSSDTGLRNYLRKDYVLAYNSGAINNGEITTRTTDVDGNLIYEAPDIGAYEYTGAASFSPVYDIADFRRLIGDWNKSVSTDNDLDYNNDNIINSRDLGFMMSNWSN